MLFAQNVLSCFHEAELRFQPRKTGRDCRGKIVAPYAEPRGKTRLTIRLDDDLVDYFLKEAEASGGATGYQSLIDDALRRHMEGKAPKLEDTLRRIVREEMRKASRV